jgi:putative acetyltransferase
MKRLFVLESGRGRGVGRRLVMDVMQRGKTMGYKTMKLDSVEELVAAKQLYLSVGFVECAAYCHNPCPTCYFMEKQL